MNNTIEIVHDEDDPQAQFAMIPHEFGRAPGLSHGAFRMYVLLRGYAWGSPWKDGSCWPSYASLAQSMGVTRRSAMRVVQELETKGCIDIERRPGGIERFRVLAVHKHPHVQAYIQGKGGVKNVTPAKKRGVKNDAGGVKNGTGGCQKWHSLPIEEETIENTQENTIAHEKEKSEPEYELAVTVATIFDLQDDPSEVSTIRRKVSRVKAIAKERGILFLDADEDFIDLAHACHKHHIAAKTKVASWSGRYGTWLENKIKFGNGKSSSNGYHPTGQSNGKPREFMGPLSDQRKKELEEENRRNIAMWKKLNPPKQQEGKIHA